MLYGVFSDIHSNLEALNIVLDYFKNCNVQSYICCGDIVGYGPYPNECVEKIRTLENLIIVMGNHDAAVCGLKDITWFNDYARKAIIWTEKKLSKENKQYISGLLKMVKVPSSYDLVLDKKINTFTVVHGSPRDPIDEYLLSTDEMYENLSFFDTNICFVGHSHVPFVFDDGLATIDYNGVIKLNKNKKYIVNVGSVGQPRDYNPLSCCVLFDTDKNELKFVRLEYDVKKVQEKMQEYNLPQYLIDRLSVGK